MLSPFEGTTSFHSLALEAHWVPISPLVLSVALKGRKLEHINNLWARWGRNSRRRGGAGVGASSAGRLLFAAKAGGGVRA